MSSSAPPPAIRVLLPDGQEINGVLHERQKTPDTWLHLVGILVWNTTGPGEVEAAEYRSWIDTDHVRPLPGVSYDAVPTRPLPHAVEPAPGTRWSWTVQHLPGRAGAAGTVVHTADCEMAGDGPQLDLDQARDALRRPGAVACTACDAAASLTPLA
ncbi:DUF6233 domain-containing protein [Streptomyces sp. NPDC057116]|uniref:DUF6233 domain-containing protein n=1 Tax=Streptomyces sp. NPDC057116 TaxID=3346023 RepID=UPI0036456A9B